MTTTTHNVDIRARSSGFRVIKRKIDEIGVSANNATRGIFLMQRALFVLGGAGAIRALVGQVDMLTNYENRLKLTATSAENLQSVQTKLFETAARSRTSFEAVAEVYNRTALSVRELGTSQAETLRFTESLSKATILSGASAREAHAALIQLGQGMASNTLRGDELRSVLEQLPFVADVIAESLGVTRGQLRELGADGKISAETILKAFREAESKIDDLFANTVPTIGQALSVANTKWLQFLDALDDTTGASAAVANSIIYIADNLNVILGVLGAVALAIVATFAGKGVQAIANYVLGLRASALASLRLLEIENLRAAASVRRNAASVAENAQRQVELSQRLALLGVQKAQLQQQVLDTQFTISNGRARNIATGQYVSLTAAKTALARVSGQLSIVEGVEATTAGRLATARGLQAGATSGAAAANARLAAAQAASVGTTAKLTSLFPTLAGAIGRAGAAMGVLTALIVANPIGAIVVAIGLAIAAFARWGNNIKVTSDGVVGLKDAAVAAFQLIRLEIAPVVTALRDTLGDAIQTVRDKTSGIYDTFSSVLSTTVQVVKTFINVTIGFFVGMYEGISAVLHLLPGVFRAVGAMAINALLDVIALGMKGVVTALASPLLLIGKGFEALGKENPFASIEKGIDNLDLSRFKQDVGSAGSDAAGAFTAAFTGAMQRDYVGAAGQALNDIATPIGQAITDRARQNLDEAAKLEAARQAEIDKVNDRVGSDAGGGKGGKGKGGSNSASFNSILNGMRKEIELLQLSNSERKMQEEILKIEKELKRGLTEQETALAAATIKALDAARVQSEVLESIVGPREEIIEQQNALNALFQQGRLGIEDYTEAMRQMQITADEVSGTMGGGFRASINSAILSTQELGSALGDIVVGGADAAADALVEFAKTGKLNLREMFLDIFANIAKLIAKQLILKALGFIFPGAGAAGGLAGGIGGLLGFSDGGSIIPTGPGATDSQVVSFAKRPDERVDILTPGQQAAQRNNMNGQGQDQSKEQTPAAAPTIVNLLDPSLVGRYMTTADGKEAIINVLREEGVI